jgi:hypothetical protein
MSHTHWEIWGIPGAASNNDCIDYQLRASVNRDRSRMKDGHEIFHHPGSSLRFQTKEWTRARAATIPHRAHLATVQSPALPEHRTDHPLGCHRLRIPERVVFEKLVQVLVFGCAYERIADASCSESTLRREGGMSGSSLE